MLQLVNKLDTRIKFVPKMCLISIVEYPKSYYHFVVVWKGSRWANQEMKMSITDSEKFKVALESAVSRIATKSDTIQAASKAFVTKRHKSDSWVHLVSQVLKKRHSGAERAMGEQSH